MATHESATATSTQCPPLQALDDRQEMLLDAISMIT